MIRIKQCPRCKGDVRLDRDQYGWYEECITCGYVHDLQVLATRERTPVPVTGRSDRRNGGASR